MNTEKIEKSSLSLILTLLIFLSGCGKSPFHHHKKDEFDSTKVRISSLESNLYLTQSDILIRPYWQIGPLVYDESKILLILSNNQNIPQDPPPLFSIKLWMPTMGHGSYPVSIKKLSKGVYEVDEIYFTMEGYWDLHFQIIQDGNVLEEVKWGFELRM